jgi:hypothetical protein
MTFFVEPYFTDSSLTFVDETTMSTGKTLQRAVVEVLGQFGRTFNRHRIEDSREWK